jgi:hypothetical protein
MKTKHMVTWLQAGLICGMCGGCEILGPLLIADATNQDEPADLSMAPLSVEIESVTGNVGGEVLEREMLTPTGERFANQLTFRLTSQSGLEITVVTPAESSNTNPYEAPVDGSELPNEGGELETPERMPDEAGIVPTPDETGAISRPDSIAGVLVCNAVTCENAEDFGIEIVQTEHGRSAIIDGFWAGEQHIALTLHYTENR